MEVIGAVGVVGAVGVRTCAAESSPVPMALSAVTVTE